MGFPIFDNGKLLFRDGALALSEDCCCNTCCTVCPNYYEIWNTGAGVLRITALDEVGSPTDTLISDAAETGCLAFLSPTLFYGEYSIIVRVECGADGLELTVDNPLTQNCVASAPLIYRLDCPEIEFEVTLSGDGSDPPACPYIGETRRFLIKPL